MELCKFLHQVLEGEISWGGGTTELQSKVSCRCEMWRWLICSGPGRVKSSAEGEVHSIKVKTNGVLIYLHTVHDTCQARPDRRHHSEWCWCLSYLIGHGSLLWKFAELRSVLMGRCGLLSGCGSSAELPQQHLRVPHYFVVAFIWSPPLV